MWNPFLLPCIAKKVTRVLIQYGIFEEGGVEEGCQQKGARSYTVHGSESWV